MSTEATSRTGRVSLWGRSFGRARDDGGAVIPLTALGIVALVAFVGFAVDVGLAFNERRQEQAAVDMATLSVVRLAFDDTGVTTDDLFDEAIRLSLANMDGSVSEAEWRERFLECTDPGRVAAGYTVPLTTSDGVVDCISVTPDVSALRMRLPDTDVQTVFASVVGFDNWTVSAFAEAGLVERAAPNIIPFAMSASGEAAGRYCLRQPQGNNNANTPAAEDCSGMFQGNTGVIQIVRPSWGAPPHNCNGGFAAVIERNIAQGIDHMLSAYPETNVVTQETCPNVTAGLSPNEISTDTGQNNMNSVEQGLILRGDGYYEDGGPARLKRGPFPKTQFIKSQALDDKPLWEFIDTTLNFGVDVPASCSPAFVVSLAPADYRVGLDNCFAEYYSGNYDHHLFTEELMESPRFTWVPESMGDLSTGTGFFWFRIQQFRPVFIQTVYYNTGNCWWGVNPGMANQMHNEGTCWQLPSAISTASANSNISLRGLGSYYFQFEMLPEEILERGVTAGGQASELALIR
ncbi:MAG: pilus assembly protein [Acidimicrobiia bacterium]|nr:pilus assembly protein [Acidimicrobiia bacterium]